MPTNRSLYTANYGKPRSKGDNLGSSHADFNLVKGAGIIGKEGYKRCLKCGRVLPMTAQSLRRKYCVGKCIPEYKSGTELITEMSIKLTKKLKDKLQSLASNQNLSAGEFIRRLIKNAS